MNECFKPNTQYKKKSLFSLYHKNTQADYLPLALPILRRHGIELKILASIKFLGVLLDENLTWKDQISTIENKVSKALG